MKKRFFVCLMAVVLGLSCVSCGTRKPEEAFKDEIDFSEPPVTITYLTIGDKPSNGMTEKIVGEINEILEKRVNAKLDVYYVSWTDYLENYNVTLETGDVNIDLIGTGSDWLDAWPNAIAGNFLPLSKEMLSKYCPVTYSHIKTDEWKKCSYNGNIYMIPENEYTQWINHGFIYRKDLAKEAGIEKISSWNDLDRYFRYVKLAYPQMIPWDSDGKNVIPTLGYLMSKQEYIPIYELSTYGIWGAYSDNMKEIVSPYYEGDEFIEYARLMKSWNDLGVWREDFDLSGDNNEEFFNGVASVVQHHTQYFFTDIKPTMEVMLPESDADFFWFGNENGNLLKTSILHGAMAVYKGSENPERALMVYDILRNDPKCYRLLRYGIEGTQYTVNQQGMMEKPSGYNSERDSFVLNFWWGRRDDLEIQDSSYSWNDYYDLVDVYNRNAKPYPWDSVPYATEEILQEIKPIVEVFDEYLPLIAYGHYDVTPEEEVEQFRQALREKGMERVTLKLQSILNSY